MGGYFCCNSIVNTNLSEESSEMSVQTIQPEIFSIDKDFPISPFSNINSELIEDVSEKLTERFNFPLY